MSSGVGRFAFGPVRAAARSSRGILADELERAIDGVLAGPMPEVVGRSVVEHRVLQRLVSEMLAAADTDGSADRRIEGLLERVQQNPELRRWLESGEASRLAEKLAEDAVRSTAFRRALSDVLSSPELRNALSQQTTGFGSELGASASTRARSLDASVESRVHAWLRRPRPAQAGFGGVASRGVALVVDAALAYLTFLVVAASVSLVAWLAGGLGHGWLAGILAASGWLVVTAAYFAGFWSGAGQTPGMRLMRLRVVDRSGSAPSTFRSLVRFVGLLAAILPFFAGFLPALVDGRRRPLPDFLAGTVVLYEPLSARASTATREAPASTTPA